jgi:hypothetical protein
VFGKTLPLKWVKRKPRTKTTDVNCLSRYICRFKTCLNAKNPVSVYRYTGTPDDDGFLSDPAALPL